MLTYFPDLGLSLISCYDCFQIFKMLNETAVALRTKAVKALTAIVSVDPSILARVWLLSFCNYKNDLTLFLHPSCRP